jgi:hypothetical protein
LHASHDAEQGPFSIFVHRKAVRTVSYTELKCTADSVRCNYFPGNPCSGTKIVFDHTGFPKGAAKHFGFGMESALL